MFCVKGKVMPPKKKKKKAGRPTKFEKKLLPKVKKLVQLGATDFEIVQILGIAMSTFSLWKAKHKAFSEALSDWKQNANKRVERSLYERAVGYKFEEEKIFCNKDGEVTRVDVVTLIPPDVRAQQYWLNNRDPDNWRHFQQVELTGKLDLGTALDSARKRTKDDK